MVKIELFFKWIKQNLKIKKFLGKSENAVKTQICIALISFVLLHLMKELKQICSEISMKNLLKIIGNNMFYTLKERKYGRCRYKDPNQLQFQWTFWLFYRTVVLPQGAGEKSLPNVTQYVLCYINQIILVKSFTPFKYDIYNPAFEKAV